MNTSAQNTPPGHIQIDVFSVFGELVDGALSTSIIGRARANGQIDLRIHDPRDHATDFHRSIDDSPFGGGAGMVMRPDVLASSIRAAEPMRPILALTPSGRRFDQAMASELAMGKGFSMLCGRYEGIDQRVIDKFVDAEVSIGDYVLAGGEVAAAVIVEAVGRLVPGVLGNAASIEEESFATGLLEYPHFTRPAEFEGESVPPILLSGNHALVERWRLAMSLRRTVERRPDLIADRGGLSTAESELLEWLRSQEQG